jgi:hypothetical protein
MTNDKPARTWGLYPNEWYPVLEIHAYENDEERATFTAEEIADIKRVEAEFNRVQKLIADRFGKTYIEERALVDDTSE